MEGGIGVYYLTYKCVETKGLKTLKNPMKSLTREEIRDELVKIAKLAGSDIENYIEIKDRGCPHNRKESKLPRDKFGIYIFREL